MKIKAILKLTRIEHSLMLVIAVLAAELIAKGLPSLPVLVLSLITPIFISMASFAINDYFDIEVDKLNGKKRPLVTGELKPIDALYVTTASLIIGIAASIFINFYAFIIALIFGALSMLYSFKLKGVVLLGNLYVAFSMAIPFIFGAYVVGQILPYSILLVTIMTFLSGTAREVHGTIRDLEGDRKARNLKTLPSLIGITGSATVALLLYAIAIFISAYLFLYVSPFKLNLAFGILISLTDIMLLYTAIGYFVARNQKFYSSARNISLAAMGLSLLAILLAPL